MRKDGARYRFSPSDLINFMRSEFITWMDRFYREFPDEIEPDLRPKSRKSSKIKGWSMSAVSWTRFRRRVSGFAI